MFSLVRSSSKKTIKKGGIVRVKNVTLKLENHTRETMEPPTDDGGFRDFYHTGRILFYNS